MTELKTILANILNSYKTLGVINGYGEVRFPSRSEITEVLTLIKDLLFPGFTTPEELHDESIESITKKRVESLALSLSGYIQDTLEWATQAHSDRKSIDITREFLEYIPELREVLRLDAKAIFDGDPASLSEAEIILSYPGFQAIMVYRIAHFLYGKNVPLIPRLMSEIVHSDTGIDIHPAARIGHHFFIDHGTGIVIGETSDIGNFVKLYQGVTLGAFSVSKDMVNGKRHPTLKDHVTVYARSTILGGETVIGEHCVIGGNVWLTESLEPYTKIYLSPEFKKSFKKHQPKSHDS